MPRGTSKANGTTNQRRCSCSMGRGIALRGIVSAMLLVVATSCTGSPRPDPSPRGSIWPSDFVVQPGDPAVGQGQLVESPGEPTRLCAGEIIIPLSKTAKYRCTPLNIEVRGVDIRAVGGVHEYIGALVVDNVVVRGIWDGVSLHVSEVGGAFPTLPGAPELTCIEEVPGAVPEGLPRPETEAAYKALEFEISSHADTYGGQWLATLRDREVMVVAALGDLTDATARVRAIFPFALCVVPAEFSLDELERIKSELRANDGASQPELALTRNRVLMRVRVLDLTVGELLSVIPPAETVQSLFGMAST